MAIFTFTGDPKAPGTDPATAELGGVTFPLNQPVDVTDAALAARLRTHSHFTAGDEASENKEGFRAVHNGGGRFVIVFGDKDEKKAKGLNKAAAEAFNALSDEEKAEAVKTFEAIE